MIRSTEPRGSALRTLLLVLVCGLALTLAVGCGGNNQEIETDPNTELPDDLNTEDVAVPEQPDFGDIDDGTANNDDVGETVPLLVFQDVFYDFDQFTLSGAAMDALANNGRILRENPRSTVLIEGHCDERGTIQYNLALGEKRAKEARTYLINLGISPSRIQTVSYGKEKPFVSGHSEAAWSQNRRAHFVSQSQGR